MNFHHLLEAVGTLAIGLLFYSYAYPRLLGPTARERGARAVVHGLAFGGLTAAMMASRIEISPGIFVDARVVPVALVGLFEGTPAALIAATVGCLYRIWIGGSGTGAGIFSLVSVATAAGLIRGWARREGGPHTRHALALAGATYALTVLAFALIGRREIERFSDMWLAYFVTCLVGIALMARLFADVPEQFRLSAERARFRAVLDEATDAIRIIDCGTQRVVDVNRADCALSGLTRDELVGRDRRDFWPEDADLRRLQEAAFAETYATGFAQTLGSPFRTGAGETIPVDTTRHVVRFQDRRYEIIIWRPARERMAAEAAARETSDLRAATLVARAAAHEINNPLAVILGYLQLLEGRWPPDSREAKWHVHMVEAGGRIRDAVGRLNRLIKVEARAAAGESPAMLDSVKSSQPAGTSPAVSPATAPAASPPPPPAPAADR
ncbi:MAG TPA: LytS/YhcK type 5TM receptor domain-containing protein [Verrucomicrobiae bacterium]|jgi:PAS domain S-box-containing protein|nr:LytS/YhcK type 5TM receptor domain-containing protein [Verrucomicrobiae bacterium]